MSLVFIIAEISTFKQTDKRTKLDRETIFFYLYIYIYVLPRPLLPVTNICTLFDHYHSCKNLTSANHLTIWLVANLKQNLNSFQPNLSFNRSERLSSIKIYAGTSTISWSRFWLIVLRLLRKSISQNVILKRKNEIQILYICSCKEWISINTIFTFSSWWYQALRKFVRKYLASCELHTCKAQTWDRFRQNSVAALFDYRTVLGRWAVHDEDEVIIRLR